MDSCEGNDVMDSCEGNSVLFRIISLRGIYAMYSFGSNYEILELILPKWILIMHDTAQ
jgi:hypothetical protein